MTYKHYPVRPLRLDADFAREEYRMLIGRIDSAEASADSAEWLSLYSDWNALKSYLNAEESRISYALSRSMNNPDCEQNEKYFREQVRPIADEGNTALLAALLVSRYSRAIGERYGEHLIRVLQTNVEPLATINSDLRVKLGELGNHYNKIVASGEISVGGRMVSLSLARNMQSSSDTNVRREAFVNYRQWYLDHRSEFAAIYNDMVAIRHKMATNLGHENFIPLAYLTLNRTDYGPQQATEFRESVRRYAVPLQTKLYERQRQELGTETLLPWDSAYTPSLTLPAGIAPIDSQLERAQRVFDAISPKLAGHFRRMVSENLIDLENRQGKQAGAYCTAFSDEGRVAIFCNSTGDEDDVSTLMHEMGHAFQGWESQAIEAVDLQWPTYDACEIHSMGMEYLSMRHITEFFSEEHAEKFRRNRWKEAVELVCYISVVDEFQHWVYENPSATPEQRDTEWSRIWDIYKPGIDFSGVEDLKHARWYAQGHIFQVPFYYIDYAIAETGAMQLAMLASDDYDRAMETYMELCRMGGTQSVLGIFRSANLRSPFDPAVMQDLMAYAESQTLEG